MFIPASYNMSKMLKSVPRQKSNLVICDQDFYTLEVPPAHAEEYAEMCNSVEHALVAGEAGNSS